MLQSLHIPKCCRRARSPKVRPPLRQGSFVMFPNYKGGSCNGTSSSTDQGSADPVCRNKEEFSLLRCQLTLNKSHEGIKLIEIPIVEDETVKTLFASYNNRNSGSHLSSHVSMTHTVVQLPSTSEKSIMADKPSAGSWLSPGNVVWAKTAHHEWWPAEIMDENVVREYSNDQHDGRMLVQLYGSQEYTWLDPVVDMSQFDYCYEERSMNPLEAFQYALKQALCKSGLTSPGISPDVCFGELKSSIQQDQPFAVSDTCNSPNSSRTEEDCNEEGRGKRKRKMKTHFDELTFPTNPARRTRRLRIMRQLGLAPPIGSPFARSHVR